MTRVGFLERTFRVSVILKGIDGVLELLGGILLLFLTPQRIGVVVGFLTQHELDEDPHDPIANAVVRMSHHLTGSATLFGAVYLLLHGAVKVVLVWAVLRRRFWAYPWMIAFLLVFIGWQCWQLTRHFGWGLVALTLFDILIVALTVREWRVQRRLRTTEAAAASGAETGAAADTGAAAE